MANMHLVTGFAGREHITAADQGAFHASVFGGGDFVFGAGNQFAASIISNNQVRVLDGDIYMQGRFIRLDKDTYVDLVIENGTQGYFRNDLIVARYTENEATAIEEVNLVVIKGEAAASDPVDPAYTTGDILVAGDMLHDMPLYRVVIDGLNLVELIPLFSVHDTEKRNIKDDDVFNIYDASDGLRKKALWKNIRNHTHTSDQITDKDVLANIVSGMLIPNIGNVHVWKQVRTTSEKVPEVPAWYTLGAVKENVVLASRATTISTNGTFYYHYGDSVTVEKNGSVNAPSDDAWAEVGRNVSAKTLMSGPLFIKGATDYISTGSGYPVADLTSDATNVFYIPAGGTLEITVDSNAKMCYVVATMYQLVSGYPCISEIPAGTHTDYLTSANAYEYTEGTVGNTSITYLGQLGEFGAKIEIGRYIGTGAYGSSNPNHLTFSGKNALISIYPIVKVSGTATPHIILQSPAQVAVVFHANGGGYDNTVNWGDGEVSWYNTGSAIGQMNISGWEYLYFIVYL